MTAHGEGERVHRLTLMVKVFRDNISIEDSFYCNNRGGKRSFFYVVFFILQYCDWANVSFSHKQKQNHNGLIVTQCSITSSSFVKTQAKKKNISSFFYKMSIVNYISKACYKMAIPPFSAAQQTLTRARLQKW